MQVVGLTGIQNQCVCAKVKLTQGLCAWTVACVWGSTTYTVVSRDARVLCSYMVAYRGQDLCMRVVTMCILEQHSCVAVSSYRSLCLHVMLI